MEHRIKKIQQVLRDKKLDAALISSPVNIVYFSNFSGFSSVERDGYILLTKRTGYILTNALYKDAVKKQVRHLKLLEYSSATPLHKHLTALIKKNNLQRIGFEADNLTVSEWKYLKKSLPKLVPIDISNIRIEKTPDEIRNIEQAAKIADRALKTVQPMIKPGISEKQAVFMLENEIRKENSDIAFPTIVAFGKNAAVPHHKSNDTLLKKNDLILVDFGATSNEYRSDMTRTFFIGKATDEHRKAYQAVLTAQQKAVDYIESQFTYSSNERSESRSNSSRLRSNSKIKASQVDQVARDSLISQGYPSIPHSLGHGIGLEVHEAPHVSPNSSEELTDGMVFSLEPGIYLPDKLGIRIEDLYVIENGKLKRLTHSPSLLQQI